MDNWVLTRATQSYPCDACTDGTTIAKGEFYWLNTATLRRLCDQGVRRDMEEIDQLRQSIDKDHAQERKSEPP